METDSFFYQLFQQLPQTLFELLGLPAARSKAYRFESVELKKAFRIDGLFVPNRRTLPLYFTEVQFQRRPRFYANLFAKVFSYLNENDPKQEWFAAALFASRKEEPKHLGPYQELPHSKRVKRIYLDETTAAKNPRVGVALVRLLFVSEQEDQELAPSVVRQAKVEFVGSDLQVKVVELAERVLMVRFTGLNVEEIRMKFKLHDIRESKAWQQLRAEGVSQGVAEGIAKGKAQTEREWIEKLSAKGMTEKQIAELLDLRVEEVRRLRNGRNGGGKA